MICFPKEETVLNVFDLITAPADGQGRVRKRNGRISVDNSRSAVIIRMHPDLVTYAEHCAGGVYECKFGAAGGLPTEALVAAWEKPFAPEAEGGCAYTLSMSVWHFGRKYFPTPSSPLVNACLLVQCVLCGNVYTPARPSLSGRQSARVVK